MKQLGEGWNWRDLKVGDKFVTYGRTIFESDLLNFVTLCGFSEELFTNREYIQEHAPMRGGHPVPGALVYSMAEGLVIPTTLQGTGLAFLSMGFDIKGPTYSYWLNTSTEPDENRAALMLGRGNFRVATSRGHLTDMVDLSPGSSLLVVLDHGTRAIPVLGTAQTWPPTEPWPPKSRDALQVTQTRLIYRMPTDNPEYQLVLITPRTGMQIPRNAANLDGARVAGAAVIEAAAGLGAAVAAAVVAAGAGVLRGGGAHTQAGGGHGGGDGRVAEASVQAEAGVHGRLGKGPGGVRGVHAVLRQGATEGDTCSTSMSRLNRGLCCAAPWRRQRSSRSAFTARVRASASSGASPRAPW